MKKLLKTAMRKTITVFITVLLLCPVSLPILETYVITDAQAIEGADTSSIGELPQ